MGYLVNGEMWLPSLGQSCKHSFEERVFAEIQASKHCVWESSQAYSEVLQLLVIHTFLLVCLLGFHNGKSGRLQCSYCASFLLLLFCIYCPLKFECPFVIGLAKKVESLIKQTIKPFLVDWFTNLN